MGHRIGVGLRAVGLHGDHYDMWLLNATRLNTRPA
jgi:hypothetical protein